MPILLLAAIFFFVYWLLSRNSNKGPYGNPIHVYAYFTCRWCKNKSDHNHEYCPKCNKNDLGLTVVEQKMVDIAAGTGRIEEYFINQHKENQEIKAKMKEIEADHQDIQKKFSTADRLISALNRVRK